MKTFIKSILVVAVIFGTYTSYANETLDVLPTFKFVNEGSQISVADISGKLIYNGNVKSNGNLIKLFDFSQLKDGIYTVEVTNDFEIETINLKVKNKEVKLLVESHEKNFKPVLRLENDKLIVSKLSPKNDAVEVELYFENELIHTETVKDYNNVFERVYKLDKTNRGDYTVIIRSNTKVFIEDFKI